MTVLSKLSLITFIVTRIVLICARKIIRRGKREALALAKKNILSNIIRRPLL